MRGDFRYALRALRKQGAPNGLMVLVLGVSLGAATAIFSLVDTALLHPLPYEEPQRLVEILERTTGGEEQLQRVLAGNFTDLARASRGFEEMAAILSTGKPITSLEEPLNPLMRRVSANYFRLLRVEPQLGRAFLPNEDRPGGPRVVILSHGLWQEHLGADPEVVGKTLGLDGEPYEIVGVLPASFRDPLYVGRPALWLPLALSEEERARDGGRHPRLTVFGRLARGWTLEAARAEVERLGAELEAGFPEANAGRIATVVSLHEVVVEGYRPALLLLFGAVVLVVIIASSNLAHLLLARALGRQREIALRIALGASRWRLARQLLAESLLLGGAGGVVGIGLAHAGLGPLLAILPEGFGVPRLDSVGIDLRAAVFAFGLALLSSLVFGLAPLAQAAAGRGGDALGTGTARTTAGPAGHRTRRLLVVAEVALSLALLTSAGLMLRTSWNLSRASPGFETPGVLTLRTSARGAEYGKPERWMDFHQRVAEALRALPGVAAVGGVNELSIRQSWSGTPLHLPGRPVEPGAEPQAMVLTVTPGYFEAMGIPLLGGRLFGPADDDGEPVVILSRGAARLLGMEGDALGRMLSVGPDDGGLRRMVGLVGDVRSSDTPLAPRATVYLPYAQNPMPTLSLAVRTSLASPASLADAAQRTVWEISRDAPVYNVTTLEQLLRDVDWQPRFLMELLVGFALLAVGLTASGVYALLSYLVAAETREIGIRMALGAERAQILRRALGRASALVGTGLLAGAPLTLIAGQVLRHQLLGVSAHDPLTLAGIVGLLVAVTLVASYLPSRRATRIDPAITLRED